ncbi:hypothetical protein [Phytohabitans rumicis]|uniref:Uncharacterized protein n=1 Tax=Phytohabitans rumicis TaxID=1076125 RepID=A0A6V8LJY8_9ACTN|nr:hypothetical protein [Phytohabitans rumicis]GFJ94387.1 hypothetical protein Prum_080290 [Phytohabitans rumicis]
MTSDEELRLRHLDHIQGIITRLAQNSFTVRGWSVSLVSVVLAVLSTQDSSAGLAPIALVPALVFWGLDAYYLRGERLYRQLYRAVANRIVAGPGAPTCPRSTWTSGATPPRCPPSPVPCSPSTSSPSPPSWWSA